MENHQIKATSFGKLPRSSPAIYLNVLYFILLHYPWIAKRLAYATYDGIICYCRLCCCVSVWRSKKMCKNSELAVPGLTTIMFPMDMLTKILMVVNQLFLCSWLLESLHWEAKGVYNGHEPDISEFMAITDSKEMPMKFIMFMSCVFLSHSNYELCWESERVCNGHTWAIPGLSAITNADMKPKVHKVVFLSPLANSM